MNAMVMAPELALPWESSREEDARYRKILRNALSAFIAFALLLPLLPLQELSREQQAAVPPQLARIMLEKRELPEPAPAKPKPRPAPKPVEKKPLEKVPDKAQAKPVEKPGVKPQQRLEDARKLAAVSGVLAFRDALSEMRDSVDVDSLSQTRVSRGQSAAIKTERSIIAANATSSGGIDTAALSRDTGGPALSGREATRVESAATGAYRGEASSASARQGGRSDDAIRRVMDRNKGGIFAIYNRALRKDPLLQGKLVFEMVIDPSGAISQLSLLSSELGDDTLTGKILARIRMIDFGAADVVTTRVNYSFDFLPY